MTDFSRKHGFWLDAARLRVGLLKRPQPGVPHMTRPKYAAELDELDKFANWLLWFEGGKKGHRPRVWRKVPPYAWQIQNEYRRRHPKPPATPPPALPPKPPAKPKPSWTLPSPLIMTASDSGSANDHAGVATIGRIVVPGVCPLWRCDTVIGPARTGWLGQIEGDDQLQVALDLLADKPAGDSKAIVGTGNVSAKKMLAAGVNVFFMELNAQAGWEPYGNTARMLFQGHQDGWPLVYPSYGVYGDVSLEAYAEYRPMVWDPDEDEFVRGTQPQGLAEYYAVFSAEGMGDTNSWPYLATL